MNKYEVLLDGKNWEYVNASDLSIENKGVIVFYKKGIVIAAFRKWIKVKLTDQGE